MVDETDGKNDIQKADRTLQISGILQPARSGDYQEVFGRYPAHSGGRCATYGGDGAGPIGEKSRPSVHEPSSRTRALLA